LGKKFGVQFTNGFLLTNFKKFNYRQIVVQGHINKNLV